MLHARHLGQTNSGHTTERNRGKAKETTTQLSQEQKLLSAQPSAVGIEVGDNGPDLLLSAMICSTLYIPWVASFNDIIWENVRTRS
jgi:hypothetical protein